MASDAAPAAALDADKVAPSASAACFFASASVMADLRSVSDCLSVLPTGGGGGIPGQTHCRLLLKESSKIFTAKPQTVLFANNDQAGQPRGSRKSRCHRVV